MTGLSVVIPCFDEAERLPSTLDAFLAALPAGVEVLVVDDGSTDGTAEAAKAAGAGDPRVRVEVCPVNRGKGAAVRVGMLAATGDRIVFTDADGSYSPAEILRVAAALDGSPVAIGTRGETPGEGTLPRRAASKLFNLAVRRMLGLPFTDTQCGVKGFRRDAAHAIFSRTRVDGFAFDTEALFLAARLGLPVAEVAVSPEERRGSKIRLATDAVRMLREMRTVRRLAARGAYRLPAPDSAWPESLRSQSNI